MRFTLIGVLLLSASGLAQETHWRDRWREGRALFDNSKYQEAVRVLLQVYEEAQDSNASSADVVAIARLLAASEYNSEKWKEAAAHYRAALDELLSADHPNARDLAQLRMQLAATIAELGQLDDARLLLCTTLQADVDPSVSFECVARLAVVALRHDSYQLAIALARRCVALIASLPAAQRGTIAADFLTNAAWLALQVGRREQSIICLQAAESVSDGTRESVNLKSVAVRVELLRAEANGDEATRRAAAALELYIPVFGKDNEWIMSLVVSLAETQLDRNEVQEAAATLARLPNALGWTGDITTRARIAQARLAQAQGEPERARKILAEVLAKRDGRLESAVALRALADLEVATGSYRRALECALEAARIDLEAIGADSEETRRSLNLVKKVRQLVRSAGIGASSLPLQQLRGIHLGDAIEDGWKDTDDRAVALLEDARRCIASSDWEMALAKLEDVGRERAGEPLLHYYRALALAGKGRLSEAIESAGDGIAYRPEPSLYALRANLHMKAEQIEQAYVDAMYALLLGPENADLLFLRGMANYKLGRLDLALGDFSASLGLAPGEARGHLWRGRTLFDLGQLEEAERELLRVLDNRQYERPSRWLLANIHRRRGEYARALGECTRLGPDPQSLWLAAVIQCDLQEWGDALVLLDRYERSGGDASQQLSLLRWLCLRQTGARKAARTTLAKGIEGGAEGDRLREVARVILEADVTRMDGLAGQDADPAVVCDACYFLGMWRALEGDREAAIRLLDRAAECKRPDLYFFQSAEVARSRLSGDSAPDGR